MKRFLLIFLVLIVLSGAALYLYRKLSAAQGQSPTSDGRVTVEPIVSHIPVKADRSFITFAKPPATPSFQYSVTNLADEHLKQLRLLLIVTDSNLCLNGAECWIEKCDIAPRATQQFYTSLDNPDAAGEHAILLIEEATAREKGWTLPPLSVTDVVRSYRDAVLRRTPVEHVLTDRRIEADRRADHCIDINEEAKELCVSGVSSFSCNPTGPHIFTFWCKSRGKSSETEPCSLPRH
jgi:hypothetical protein